MSRKQIPLDDKTIGGRLRLFREKIPVNTNVFSELINISRGSLSDMENNNRLPSAKAIKNLCQLSDINIYWLYTGEGKMTRASKNEAGKSGKDSLLYDRTDGDEVRSSPAEDEVNPEMAELVGKTREILSSDTDYAASLSTNIRSFHQTVTNEKQLHRDMSEVKDAIKVLLGECDEIKERLSRSDSAIRREDTEEQRDYVRKKRAV